MRVNQIIRLLKLDDEVIKILENIGELMKSQVVTERKLRPLLKLQAEEQIKMINNLL